MRGRIAEGGLEMDEVLFGPWPPLPTAQTLWWLHPSVLTQSKPNVGEVGHVTSLRHGMRFPIDEAGGDELVDRGLGLNDLSAPEMRAVRSGVPATVARWAPLMSRGCVS